VPKEEYVTEPENKEQLDNLPEQPADQPMSGPTNGEGAGRPGLTEITIPPGSTEVRQAQWAWIWGGAPWLIVAVLFGFQDPRSGFLIFAIGLGIAVTIPRYLSWRRTAYYVTHNSVIFQRGLLGNSQMYNLPAEQFQRVVQRPGLFGRYLGYHAIDIRMREGGKVSLAYVPASSGLTEKIITMRDRYSDYDEAQELHELAMISARQRGEIPEDYVKASEAPLEPTNDSSADRPTGASEYRPEVTEFKADDEKRDR
jgi:hypothetical protein